RTIRRAAQLEVRYGGNGTKSESVARGRLAAGRRRRTRARRRHGDAAAAGTVADNTRVSAVGAASLDAPAGLNATMRRRLHGAGSVRTRGAALSGAAMSGALSAAVPAAMPAAMPGVALSATATATD